MNDSELRGSVLKKFYEVRHRLDWLEFNPLSTHILADRRQLANVCVQLGQHGLIEWKPINGPLGVVVAGMGRITAKGVDVIEGTASAPITVTLFHDQSISVSGSSHVQIGSANQQNVGSHITNLLTAVDEMNEPEAAKAEAKSLIEKITTNPLVAAALGAVLGKTLDS